MTNNEIDELIEHYGLDGEAGKIAQRLCQDVVRQTRYEYFRLIQEANNAASERVITQRDLSRFVWEKEHPRETEDA